MERELVLKEIRWVVHIIGEAKVVRIRVQIMTTSNYSVDCVEQERQAEGSSLSSEPYSL